MMAESVFVLSKPSIVVPQPFGTTPTLEIVANHNIFGLKTQARS